MQSPKIKSKILFVRADHGACSYYRMVLPFKALKKAGYDVNIDPTYDDFVSADILIFQRQYNEAALNEIMKWKKKGKKIIVDYDDNFLSLEDHNPAKKYYEGKALDVFKETMTAADVVTVSVEPLVSSYSDLNKNIIVLPNSIDEEAFSFKHSRSANLIVGWQGGFSHSPDLKLIKSVINELIKKEHFEFVLSGFNIPGLFKQSTYRGWLPFSENLSHHANFSDFGIGLCPLTQSDFNKCKSDSKFMEYATLGIPTVATDIVTYSTIDSGVTGYLARNLSDWRRYITKLVNDESKRKEIGENARDYVLSERTIQKNIWRWEEMLSNL